MQKDRLFLSPVEKELRFDHWRREQGIKMFLLDLDDTICPTRQIFLDVMSQACDFLATRTSSISREEWKKVVEDSNNRFFEKLGVNPNRWDRVVDEVGQMYSLTADTVRETKEIFQQIYTTPLAMLPGAKEGLDFMSRLMLPTGIVTHANREWTWRKYNWLDLGRFVDWDDIFIVDENGHKTAESWLEATRYFKVSPGECAVIGDSPRSDINPACEIGVEHCFLVEDDKQWSLHHQPVNGRVRKISSLDQIAEVVLSA